MYNVTALARPKHSHERFVEITINITAKNNVAAMSSFLNDWEIHDKTDLKAIRKSNEI